MLNSVTIAVLQTVFTKLKVVGREEISPMVLGKCTWAGIFMGLAHGHLVLFPGGLRSFDGLSLPLCP
jgi:hypothetical protein